MQQQMKKADEIKEEFYNLLEQSINQIANSDFKILLGDFNAKVGKEDIYKPTNGNESLRNETNNNGNKLFSSQYLKVLMYEVQQFHIRISITIHGIQQTVGERIK